MIYEAFVVTGNYGWAFLHSFPGEKGMSREAWRDEGWMNFDFPIHPFKQCREAPSKFPYPKKGLINPRFLQKLDCHKPCWDQARLSSLVNKQVDTKPGVGDKRSMNIIYI